MLVASDGHLSVPDYHNDVMLRSPQEVWIRVLGAVVAILGFYYVFTARRETKDFFWATVWGRPPMLP